MEIISTRAIDITGLALDGLYARQQAIASNTANVMTPDYQRKDVAFEDQLKEMIAKNDLQEKIKLANSTSITYNPSSLESVVQKPTSKQMEFLSEDVYKAFKPQIVMDDAKYNEINGNNVDIESEMMNMAQTGMRYNVLTTLQGRMFSGILSAIKGQ